MSPLANVWRRTLKGAMVFWLLCLLLAGFESMFGDHIIIAMAFFASVPVLVAYLIWANRAIMTRGRRGLLTLGLSGLSVFCAASVILLVGLYAAARLKSALQFEAVG